MDKKQTKQNKKTLLLRIGFLNYGFFTGVVILITLVITGCSVNVWQMASQFLIIRVSYYRSGTRSSKMGDTLREYNNDDTIRARIEDSRRKYPVFDAIPHSFFEPMSYRIGVK